MIKRVKKHFSRIDDVPEVFKGTIIIIQMNSTGKTFHEVGFIGVKTQRCKERGAFREL